MKNLVLSRGFLALVALVPSLATAALKDVGPVDPAPGSGFPLWYRDARGVAVQLCRSTAPSPNPAAGGAPMCFPSEPNPAGYGGNFGDEQFYFMAAATVPGPTGLMWEAALEATYGNGTPLRGDEVVFGRIRIRGTVPVTGTYRILHPYGEDVIQVDALGSRNINFT